MPRPLLLAGLFVLTAASCFAHGVDSSVDQGACVTVSCTFDDGSPMAFETYEIQSPAGGPPFQVGRTDRLGRVVFVPDREGSWSVKIMGEDGHGSVVAVDVDANLATAGTARNAAPLGRSAKLMTGVGVLLGVFGLVSLGMQRRKG